MKIEAEFIFICVKNGVSEPLAWKLFDYIQSKDGLLSEYEVRLYLGLGEEKSQRLISELVKAEYATEDVEYGVSGKAYVNEQPDEDINLLAEVELGVRKPLWEQ